MPTPILFPKVGAAVRSTLSSWIVEDGDSVSTGDLLYYVEHGDTIEEISSPATGRLHIVGQPGIIYSAGDVIGSIT